VDLHFCELPLYQHVRRLDRVCTRREAAAVRRSGDPIRAFATVWASKEAACKVFSKRFGGLRFVPAEYELQIDNREICEVAESLVNFAGQAVEVSVFHSKRWVHAVATSGALKVRWRVCEIGDCFLGTRKAAGESEAVRFLATSLLRECGADVVHLQFAERVPVLHNVDGGAAGMDVSLSHHGAFAAAAITSPIGGNFYEPAQDAGALPLNTRPGIPLGKSLDNSEDVCSTCTA
jgi:phosphopantetheinyl transferase (holo-ACP synthase)